MVLPAPPAHDAHGPAEAEWIARVKLGLRLSRAGILILVDRARPERLGELVRALVREHPDLEVHTDVRAVYEVPEKSVMVLAPEPSDADWLNLQRPVFARRALKVVLWCERETTEALARGAVDFYDWISQYNECPPGMPEHAIRGIRCALLARAPGILWKGERDGEELILLLRSALPRRSFRCFYDVDYEFLLAKLRTAGKTWVIVDIPGQFHLFHTRWALAEARRRGRAILIAPDTDSPGWWPVHDRLMRLADARRLLLDAGAKSPGRLVALAGLEPEAVELLKAMVQGGASEDALNRVLVDATDPGAMIALQARATGLISLEPVAAMNSTPPVLRALGRDPEVRRLQRERLDRLTAWLASHEQVSGVDAGWWAAFARESLPFTAEILRPLGVRAFVIEHHLRKGSRSPHLWETFASTALAFGDSSAAVWWARRSIEDEGETIGALQLLGMGLTREGRWREAEELFRRLLDSPVGSSSAFGDNDKNMVLSWLAETLIAQGRYRDAEHVVRQSFGESPGDDIDPTLATMIGHVLQKLARSTEAERWLRAALAREDTLTSFARLLARQELAECLAGQGNHTEALSVIDEGLRRAEGDAQIEQHPGYGDALQTVAGIFAEQGRNLEALEWMDRGLASTGQRLGVAHPSFIGRIPYLARVLNHLGRFQESEILLRKTLWLTLPASTQRESELPTSEHSFGSRYGGAPLQSEAMLGQLLALRESDIALHESDKIAALRYLADALAAQGRNEEAVPLMRTVVEAQENATNPQHPTLCPLLISLARMLAASGQLADAEEELQRAMEIGLGALGPHHPWTREALNSLAVVRGLAR